MTNHKVVLGDTVVAELDSDKNLLLNLEFLANVEVYSNMVNPNSPMELDTDINMVTRPTNMVNGRVSKLSKVYLYTPAGVTRPTRPKTTLPGGDYQYPPHGNFNDPMNEIWPILQLKTGNLHTYKKLGTQPTPQSADETITSSAVVEKINTDLGLSGNHKLIIDGENNVLRMGDHYLYVCSKGMQCKNSETWKSAKLLHDKKGFFTLTNILIMAGILILVIVIIMLLTKKKQSYNYGDYDFETHESYGYMPGRESYTHMNNHPPSAYNFRSSYY